MWFCKRDSTTSKRSKIPVRVKITWKGGSGWWEQCSLWINSNQVTTEWCRYICFSYHWQVFWMSKLLSDWNCVVLMRSRVDCAHDVIIVLKCWCCTLMGWSLWRSRLMCSVDALVCWVLTIWRRLPRAQDNGLSTIRTAHTPTHHRPHANTPRHQHASAPLGWVRKTRRWNSSIAPSGSAIHLQFWLICFGFNFLGKLTVQFHLSATWKL